MFSHKLPIMSYVNHTFFCRKKESCQLKDRKHLGSIKCYVISKEGQKKDKTITIKVESQKEDLNTKVSSSLVITFIFHT